MAGIVRLGAVIRFASYPVPKREKNRLRKEGQLPMPDETLQWLSEGPNWSESPLPDKFSSCSDGNQSPSKQPPYLDSASTFLGDTLLGPTEMESSEMPEVRSDGEEVQNKVRQILGTQSASEVNIETLSHPADEGRDLTATLKNVANTYEYLRSLGFSDETLGPLANTYDYLTDLNNRDTTELLQSTHLVGEAKSLVLDDACLEDHQ
jgi:hypothetical protein